MPRDKISQVRYGGLRRPVEDYDLDRRGVEAQQCAKLTRTNRPFGLTIKLSRDFASREEGDRKIAIPRSRKLQAKFVKYREKFRGFVPARFMHCGYAS